MSPLNCLALYFMTTKMNQMFNISILNHIQLNYDTIRLVKLYIDAHTDTYWQCNYTYNVNKYRFLCIYGSRDGERDYLHSGGDTHGAILLGTTELTDVLIKPMNKLRRVMQYVIVLLHKCISNLFFQESSPQIYKNPAASN